MFSRNRTRIQSDRYIKKRRKKIIIVTILFIVALGSVITALSLLSEANFIRITSVEVTGTSLVPTDSVRTEVENEITGAWWKIFSKDSIFLYPRYSLEQKIVKNFPPIASVSFSNVGFHSLDVKVTERSPFALACNTADEDTASSASSPCFYMDSSGFIYAPAPQFSPGVYVTYTVSTSSVSSAPSAPSTPDQFALGTSITDPADFAVAHQAVDYISGLGLTVVGIEIPAFTGESISNTNATSTGDFQLFIQRPVSTMAASSSSSVITVYFNTNQPITTTFKYFSAFWQHETNKNFQYIDLRYGKDIVFKME